MFAYKLPSGVEGLGFFPGRKNNELCRKRQQYRVHPFTVSVYDADKVMLRENPSRIVPQVVLDLTTTFEVNDLQVLNPIFVVNKRLVDEGRFPYLEGMFNVFVISHKKTHSGLCEIEDEEFIIDPLDGSWSLIRSIVNINAEMSKAMVAKRNGRKCCTAPISLSIEDALKIMKELKENYTMKNKKRRVYNINDGVSGVIQSIQTEKLVAKIKNVAAFHRVFGYFSTCRYNISYTRRGYVSMQTCLGLLISRKEVGGSEEFSNMKFQYDIAAQSATVQFDITVNSPIVVQTLLKENRKAFKVYFFEKWIKNARVSYAASSISEDRSYNTHKRKRDLDVEALIDVKVLVYYFSS